MYYSLHGRYFIDALAASRDLVAHIERDWPHADLALSEIVRLCRLA